MAVGFKQVGFIGLGRMGQPMARNLLRGRLVVYDRLPEAMAPLVEAGAEQATLTIMVGAMGRSSGGSGPSLRFWVGKSSTLRRPRATGRRIFRPSGELFRAWAGL